MKYKNSEFVEKRLFDACVNCGSPLTPTGIFNPLRADCHTCFWIHYVVHEVDSKTDTISVLVEARFSEDLAESYYGELSDKEW